MIREGQGWREAEWSEALELVAGRLQSIRGRDGAEALGALASPHQTLEELYLLQKLMRALGSNNIDHRLAQSDFSADGKQAGVGWLGMPVVDIPHLDRILVIGSSLRKDHPLLAHRIRQAVRHRAQLCAINPVDDDWLTKVTAKLIVAPAAMVSALTEVALALAEAGATVDAKDQLSGVKVSDHARAIAASLMSGERKAVFLGNLAQHHPHYAQLHALAQSIAGASGAVLGILGEAANSVGAQVVKALPGAEGMNAGLMLDQPRKAYLLLGSEPELDAYDAQSAMGAMRAADFVVALSAYKHKAVDYAHVLLPIAPYTETAGSFISTEGRLQSFYGVVKPMGETRPAWKVLRVLGNLLGLEGFDFNGAEDVLREALPRGQDDVTASLDNTIAQIAITNAQAPNGLQRIGETPIYQLDPLVRRAPSLQKTTDAAEPAAWLPASLLAKLGVTEGDAVIVRQGNGMATLRAMPDERLPQNCVRVAAAHPLTAGLGARFGEITVEKA
jgi:NADH-quinone oxidoreductase subunit G